MKKNAPTLLILLLAPAYSLAYIDPGTGHLLSQVLMAGIAGALFHFRNLIKLCFKRGTWKTPGKTTGDATKTLPPIS